MEEKFLEFKLYGCIFTGEKEVSLDELTDAFIEFCEDQGWKFCGLTLPLDIEEEF